MVAMERGGVMMWPLVLVSFVSLTFILERAFFFSRLFWSRKPRYIHRILAHAEKGRYGRAEALARRARRDFVARTLLNGLAHRNYSPEQALETQALVELNHMRRYLSVLDTVITAAPLLGILGTVLGIIHSFDVIGLVGVSDPLAVTKGISEALVTTAFGLMIALGTLVPYNYYQSLCQKAAQELETFCSILELLMHRFPERGKISRRISP